MLQIIQPSLTLLCISFFLVCTLIWITCEEATTRNRWYLRTSPGQQLLTCHGRWLAWWCSMGQQEVTWRLYPDGEGERRFSQFSRRCRQISWTGPRFRNCTSPQTCSGQGSPLSDCKDIPRLARQRNRKLGIRTYNTKCCLEKAPHLWEPGRRRQCCWRERPNELIGNPTGAQSRTRIRRSRNEWHSSQPALVSGNVISNNVDRHCSFKCLKYMHKSAKNKTTQHLMNRTDRHSKRHQPRDLLNPCLPGVCVVQEAFVLFVTQECDFEDWEWFHRGIRTVRCLWIVTNVFQLKYLGLNSSHVFLRASYFCCKTQYFFFVFLLVRAVPSFDSTFSMYWTPNRWRSVGKSQGLVFLGVFVCVCPHFGCDPELKDPCCLSRSMLWSWVTINNCFIIQLGVFERYSGQGGRVTGY